MVNGVAFSIPAPELTRAGVLTNRAERRRATVPSLLAAGVAIARLSYGRLNIREASPTGDGRTQLRLGVGGGLATSPVSLSLSASELSEPLAHG